MTTKVIHKIGYLLYIYEGSEKFILTYYNSI